MTTATEYPLLGIAATSSMTTPVQATLAIPPSVEYVAVGRAVVGRAVVGVVSPEGPALSRGVVVVVESGALVTPGCGDRDEDAPGDDGVLGVSGAGAGGGTEAGTVKVGPFGGRSVTSAATMKVAAHTTASDPPEAASHRLVMNRRGGRIDRDCHHRLGRALRKP